MLGPVAGALLAAAMAGGGALHARLEWTAGDEPAVPGRVVRSAVVVLENRTEESACALRSIGWANGVPRLGWRAPLTGRTEVRADGRVAYDATPRALTDLRFELGALLPGETLRLPLPFVAGDASSIGPELMLHYLVVGGPGHDLEREVLLPEGDGISGATYVPLTYDLARARNGQGGGALLIRSTMSDDGYAWHEANERVALDGPERRDDPARTGGLTHADAVALAGREEATAVYLEACGVWLVAASAGETALLTRDAEENWRAAPFQAPIAPGAAHFFAVADGPVQALLDAETFGDLVEVRQPHAGVHFDPGATLLEGEVLAAVLSRAAASAVEISVAAIDPDGLGAYHVATFGVAVDARGRRPD